ncbi:MAG TPA: glycosyltransferase family 2 protein [Chitinophagales bacterium]|nr:glycosyltransferase family 2 protein [Chitinophagales bacterium]HLP49992.1 glycosyltransferase family 2 protein [Chitinophagales bacterium]
MQISVVIPLFNEEESLPELAAWIERVMKANNFTYEVLMIDDGSKDKSWKVIEQLSQQNPNIKGIKFKKNYGKSAGLQVGFSHAQGDVVITMDADLQDSPDEIPELYRMIVEDDFDLVSGWKAKRYDPISKTIPTKIYNGATRFMTGIQLHDMNCGLKSYKNEVVKSVEVYGEMHRYIPVLAKKAGYGNIGEKVVVHQARKYGTTKFGMERFLYGFLDLLSVTFMTRFANRPMHIFGGLGVLSFFLGFCITLLLTIQKFVFMQFHMTDRPLFYLGLVFLVIGTQLFVAGFLGELISRKAADRNQYDIARRVNL